MANGPHICSHQVWKQAVAVKTLERPYCKSKIFSFFSLVLQRFFLFYNHLSSLMFVGKVNSTSCAENWKTEVSVTQEPPNRQPVSESRADLAVLRPFSSLADSRTNPFSESSYLNLVPLPSSVGPESHLISPHFSTRPPHSTLFRILRCVFLGLARKSQR